MASADIWLDFETLKHNVKHNTVDRLKQILQGFNDDCHTNFTKTGKKQDLIDKITQVLDNWRRNNDTKNWESGRRILNQVRTTGMYSKGSPYSSAPPYGSAGSSSNIVFPAQPSSSSNLPRFDPYAPPRRPAASISSAVPSASSSAAPGIRFKSSPFFKVDRSVSNVVECPESNSQMDRRQQSLTFTVNNDMIQKLSSHSPKYQLRLYCTSSAYYSPTPAFRPPGLCPIEFPPTCEVRVNNTQLTANLKGMKKKPGTAPPPDLGKSVRLNNGAVNRVEMVYVNSQQPVQSKKYYLVVMLVEVTTVEQLIDKLRKGKYKSSNDILQKMTQLSLEDDDIVAGHQKMALKCPLSYMRITTPCRSWLCVHSQCFDAFSWFSVMEQTTTWLCPVCEKVLNVDDLIVDGYFDEILKATPEDVEDVIVEADGQWHTEDNTYGSTSWKATHPPSIAKNLTVPRSTPAKRRSPTPVRRNADINGKAKLAPNNAEIVILDSDDEDEDEGRVKRELSPSYDGTQKISQTRANASFATLPPRSQTQESDVIDLTLDSDDETPAVTASPLTKKRKSDERDTQSPTEQIWKKSRADPVVSPALSVNAGGIPAITPTSDILGVSYSPRHPARPLPPVSPTGNRYNGNTYSPHYVPSYPPSGHPSLPPRPTTATLLNGHHNPNNTGSQPYRPNTLPNGASSSSGSWRR